MQDNAYAYCMMLADQKVTVWEQVDEEAAIRANTTILLGNLAPHLSEATCKRVMLNAFTRALKDSFPPARAAGLKVHPPPCAFFTLSWEIMLPACCCVVYNAVLHTLLLCIHL